MNELQRIHLGEALREHLDQSFVFLDRKEPATFRNEELSQWPKPWPDFQDGIRLTQITTLNNSSQLIGIVKKILPERFRQPNVRVSQELPNISHIHAFLIF
jgi:hypothetical protein